MVSTNLMGQLRFNIHISQDPTYSMETTCTSLYYHGIWHTYFLFLLPLVTHYHPLFRQRKLTEYVTNAELLKAQITVIVTNNNKSNVIERSYSVPICYI